MSNKNRSLKVFLCHAHSDREAVRRLYQYLTQHGVDAWLDKEKLLPGQEWELEIKRAVREADVVTICLSCQFNQAGFRQKEVRLALDTAMEKPEGDIFIIPARLEECEPPESLKKWQWVDLFEADGYERLMRALLLRAEKTGIALKMGGPLPEKRQDVRLVTTGTALPPSHSGWQLGDRVLAKYSANEYWYPATIRSLAGGRIYVHFDDGDKEWKSADCVLPIDIEVGDSVLCKYKDSPYYYSAHVLQLEGERIRVRYDYDGAASPAEPAMGEEEWNTISAVCVSR